MMAFYIWGNEPTVLGVVGIFTVLGGSLIYTVVRMNESRPNPVNLQNSTNAIAMTEHKS